jgi:hypothetical protein
MFTEKNVHLKSQWEILLSVVILLIIGALIGFTIGLFIDNSPELQASIEEKSTLYQNSEIARNLVLVLGACLGAPFVAWRTFIADRQTKNSKDGLITNRMNQATDKLSAIKIVPRYEKNANGEWDLWEKETVDIGARHAGLHALQRIANDSEKDFFPIAEIIAEYIPRRSREVMNLNVDSSEENYSTFFDSKLSSDIDAAIDILHKILISQRNSIFEEDTAINIKNAFLRHANLRNKTFIGFDFTNSDFSYANLTNTSLVECWLEGVDLRFSDMEGVELVGSVLRGSDLREVENLSSENLKLTFGVREGAAVTQLPINIKKEDIMHWHKSDFMEDSIQASRAFMKDFSIWREKNTDKLPLEIYKKARGTKKYKDSTMK